MDRVKNPQSRTREETGVEKLTDLPFFRKMVEREQLNYEQYKEKLSRKGESSLLDESRICENEWEDENDKGYE